MSERISPKEPFQLPVLLYHRVAPAIDDFFCLGPVEFEDQMRLVAENWQTITVMEAWRHCRSGNPPPDRSMVLTFDDGYADFREYAFPILERYGIRATVFLPTDLLGGDNRWNPRAAYLCRHLSWAEVGALAAQGVEFSAHGSSHQNLVKFSAEEIAAEVLNSKKAIARQLGTAAGSFAYPFGEFNQLVTRIVAANFELAFSVTQGVWDWRANPYAIRRHLVHPGFDWSQVEQAA